MSGLGEGSTARLTRSEYNKIFVMDHYLALHNTLRTMTDRTITHRYSHYVLVFDEIHNVRQLQKDVDATKVYNSLEKIIKLTHDTKVLLVTATPMTNDVDQLESTIKLLTDDDGRHRFNGIVSYNSKIRHGPMCYYRGKRGFLNNTKIYPSTMISHQKEYHIKEEDKGSPEDIYRTLTHISLFCFPGDRLFGRNLYTKGIMYPTKEEQRITSVSTSVSRTIKYISYHVKEEYQEWLTGSNLRKCSSKYSKLMDILQDPTKNKGPVFVFVEEVKGSGLLLLATILEAHGYELYVGDHLSTIRPRKRYTFCIGDQSLVPNMSERLEGFNHPMNMRGEYVNILLGSKVISESITLLNVRMFHVMTIHWNDSTVEQAIGRVIRSGSHDALPVEERTVDIYIHLAMYKDGSTKVGTDLLKVAMCNRKQEQISVMEEQLREAAIDKFIDRPMRDEELDPSTFLRYYMDRFQEYMWEHLGNALLGSNIRIGPVSVDEIIRKMSTVHPKVAMELIYRTVTTNKKTFGMYMREGNNKLHLVRDPTKPFFSVYDPNAGPLAVQHDPIVTIKPTVPAYDKKMARRIVEMEADRKVEVLRDLHFIDRISLVENMVAKGLDPDVEHMFKALFIRYHGDLYHIMCYRIPGDAYTAVLPIPKPNTLQNKTRILGKTGWKFLEGVDKVPEKNIIDALEAQYEKIMGRIDHREHVYMIMSLIDNKARIRTRILEQTTKGDQDKRFVRKGRCLSSILKTDLALVYAYVTVYVKGYKPEEQAYREMSLYDKHVKIYGYKSVRDMWKRDPDMYNGFVGGLGKGRSQDIVREVEAMMVEEGKYIFL
ncbi:hypothetical protein BGZ89_005715 [Linnemannia elongata]|nr:hypothetical protein BGZ89_005715 [Linnemannia elongata]